MKYPSILIGKYKDKFLHFAGQQFLYLAAPTRSGKGVGIVIPNLLNYADSVVCVDIKFENFLFTAGFREKCGQKVFLFSPDGFAESEEMRKNGEIKSHHYNPLHYIRRDMKYRDGDVQKIVDILFPPNDGDIWKGLAGNLAKGLICYLLDTEQNQLAERKWNHNIKVIKPTIPLMMKLGTDKGGYSVGRVQTPTLGLIVRRYLANKHHKESYYYNLSGNFDFQGKILNAKLVITDTVPDTTALWFEQQLAIEKGELSVDEFLDEIEKFVDEQIESAKNVKLEVKGEPCSCGQGVLVLKKFKGSEFFACTAYPACTISKPALNGLTFIGVCSLVA